MRIGAKLWQPRQWWWYSTLLSFFLFFFLKDNIIGKKTIFQKPTGIEPSPHKRQTEGFTKWAAHAAQPFFLMNMIAVAIAVFLSHFKYHSLSPSPLLQIQLARISGNSQKLLILLRSYLTYSYFLAKYKSKVLKVGNQNTLLNSLPKNPLKFITFVELPWLQVFSLMVDILNEDGRCYDIWYKANILNFIQLIRWFYTILHKLLIYTFPCGESISFRSFMPSPIFPVWRYLHQYTPYAT